MALDSDKKLFIAVGVFAVLGGALFFQNRAAKEDMKAHTFEGANEDLPKLTVSEDLTKKLTKFTIVQPEKKGDAPKPGSTHTLVKDGDKWRLAEPLAAAANQSNVESLLKNLPKLSIKERIVQGTESYKQYELSDDTALHFTAFEGDKPAVEFWIGKSGGRGQMVRMKDKPGVFVLDGYSGFLYGRDTKGWRDLSIMTAETEKATRVDIENEKGTFVFKKEGGAWKADFKSAKGAASKIKDFDPTKVDDLLRAYKSLNASGFGDGKTLAEVGLEKPAAKLVITLEDGSKRELLFGGPAEGSSRYLKLASGEQVYAVSAWAGDWATADETKFAKKAGDDAKGPPGGDDPHMGMPGLEGMQMPAME